MIKLAPVSGHGSVNLSRQWRRATPTWLWWITSIALLIYSCVLLRLEAQTSQEYVRPYFSDILNVIPFFAVNTTLSSTLQFCAAIMLVFAASEASLPNRQRALYAIQGFLLLYTAADDRFMFHERLSTFLDIGDGWIMLALSSINLSAYFVLFRPSYFSLSMLISLLCAAALFFIMMVFDTLLPENMYLRLSFEDLSKTWACFFLFTFGWATAKFSHSRDPHPLTIPSILQPITPARWRDAVSVAQDRNADSDDQSV